MESDAKNVGILIANTYCEFNLSFAPPEKRELFLGPFAYAGSEAENHQKAIIEVLKSPIILVAETKGDIVGIIRGRKERLASLFVRKDHHYQGIGRKLVNQFEREIIAQDNNVIRVASTLYAVRFYKKLGYMKSTGIRRGCSFYGSGFRYQPMKKLLMTSSSLPNS